MDILDRPRSAAPTSLNRALAYDRRHANRRASFVLEHRLARGPAGWHLARQWRGVGGESLYAEAVDWHPLLGLRAVQASAPSLGEQLAAQVVDGAGGAPAFDTERTAAPGMAPRRRRLAPPRPAFTLASAPLEIVAQWPALLAGQRLRRCFLVLKVQRFAAVDFALVDDSGGTATIALTPVALPLRWWFGRTLFHFDRREVALRAIDGLLDPRDRRPNGRWHEYLGRLEFDTPVPLRAVLAGATP